MNRITSKLRTFAGWRKVALGGAAVGAAAGSVAAAKPELPKEARRVVKEYSSAGTLAAILGINAGTFALFLSGRRFPSFAKFMERHFVLSRKNVTQGRWWTIMTSTISHETVPHFAFNMLALCSIGSSLYHAVGHVDFMTIYLGGALSASLLSGLRMFAQRSKMGSIGASGGLLSLISAYCLVNPDAELRLLLLPFFTFSAINLLPVVIGFDAIGLLMGWKFLDHAGHLGGAFFGLSYFMWARNSSTATTTNGTRLLGSAAYIGELEHYRLEGRGKLFHDDGRVYEGDFHQDQYNGFGKLTDHIGDYSFEGRFRDNQLLPGSRGVYTRLEDGVHQEATVSDTREIVVG